MKLVIGNKNYSSWSLRAWLMLAAHQIDFDEINVRLSTESTAAEIKKYSPAGKVPVLHDGDVIIWDSLAICEYVSEKYLNGGGWPEDIVKRGVARSCAAEMHSGFFDLRKEMPMNCRATGRKVDITDALQKEIFRIDRIWTELRSQYSKDGSWLFGEFSIADCMFAPVVFRFVTYGVSISAESREYINTSLSHEMMQKWLDEAKKEKEIIENEEVGMQFIK